MLNAVAATTGTSVAAIVAVFTGGSGDGVVVGSAGRVDVIVISTETATSTTPVGTNVLVGVSGVLVGITVHVGRGVLVGGTAVDVLVAVSVGTEVATGTVTVGLLATIVWGNSAELQPESKNRQQSSR